jgi:hypothetical protein
MNEQEHMMRAAGSMARLVSAQRIRGTEARMGDGGDERSEQRERPHSRAQRHEPARRYDSFVVRVWRHPGKNRLTRADVRHVQSGTSESAIDCDANWIRDVLEGRLTEAGPVEE